jgi:glycosyltransferase involved in cell wall biosynthesis
MHVCFPLPPIERFSPTSGGAIATCVMQVARGLIARGHEVSILADNQGDDAYDVGQFVSIRCLLSGGANVWQRALSKYRYRRYHYDWPRYDLYIREVQRAICLHQLRPDVIVLENDLHGSAMLRHAVPQAKQVLWLHNEQGTRHPQPARLFQAVGLIVTNSDYISRYTQRRYGLSSNLFQTIHNGVDRDAFHPRADYDKPRQRVKVLFLGRLDWNKGVDLAVDAVSALREEGHSAEMTVAGGEWFFDSEHGVSSPFVRKLRARMQATGVHYLGHLPRDQVAALVREHDVVCVLSRSQEPFGLVVLEAMASGCAVVASDRGGLPEACGGAATLVDVADQVSTIDTLRRLITSPEHLASSKRASVQRAALAGWDRTAGMFEQALLHALESGKQSAYRHTRTADIVRACSV